MTPIEVLLVEDSAGDVLLTIEAFRDANPAVRINVATDGVEAMAMLRRLEPSRQARPDLILLDLNLPRMDGREVLASIKQDPVLRSIPTLILTTSNAETDIINSYRLGANGYLTKPVQFDDFDLLVRSLNDFWFNKVTLPPQKEPS